MATCNSSSNPSLPFRLLRRDSNFVGETFSDRPSVIPDGGTVSSALVLAAVVDTWVAVCVCGVGGGGK